jgi:Protein of unknown function (DUF973)/zinc-ribbon domain
MASSGCPFCGTPNAVGSRFCQRCGRPLGGGPPAPLPPGASGIPAAPPPAPYPPTPHAPAPYAPGPYPPAPGPYPLAPGYFWPDNAPVLRATDAPALDALDMFVLLSLAGVVLGLIVQFGIGPSVGFSVFAVGSTAAPLATSATIWTLVALAAVSAAIYLISLVLLRQGFVRLRALAPGQFSTPASLVTVGIVGIVLVILGLLLAFGGLVALVDCAGTTTPIPPGCVNIGEILGGAVLALVGAVLVIVGIVGAVLGLWRAGERYSESLVKAGAILWIFPFVNVVGLILLLVGLRSARRKLL